MSNEATLLIIVAIWLLSGRGLNLCFVILVYYAAYISSTSLPGQAVCIDDINYVSGYYLLQTSIDCAVLSLCFIICAINKKSIIFYYAYAAIVATSLICSFLMLLDQSFSVGRLSELHELRQEFSIPIDLFFAAIGSKAGERFSSCIFLLTGRRSGYNRFHGD
jgi:hypothetical protein